MTFRILPAVLAAFVSASAFARDATPAEIELIRSAMAEKLKDAESARFLDVKLLEQFTVCGKVNSKNSYGAYAGYTAFMGLIFAESNTAIVVGIDEAGKDIVASICKDKGYSG